MAIRNAVNTLEVSHVQIISTIRLNRSLSAVIHIHQFTIRFFFTSASNVNNTKSMDCFSRFFFSTTLHVSSFLFYLFYLYFIFFSLSFSLFCNCHSSLLFVLFLCLFLTVLFYSIQLVCFSLLPPNSSFSHHFLFFSYYITTSLAASTYLKYADKSSDAVKTFGYGQEGRSAGCGM